MRQLSAPGRFAVCLATSLAVASSAGCMSVGDEGAKPSPSRSAGRHGAAVEPAGGTDAGSGVSAGGQGRTGEGADGHVHPDKGGKAGKGGKGASSAPSSPDAPSSAPSKGVRPQPGGPTPPRVEPVPSEPTRPAPPPSDPPAQSPAPEPEPDPEPTPVPSASPAAYTRPGELSPWDGAGMRKEPAASPQVGPV